MNDREYMALAIKEAKKAFLAGEIPIGALITYNDTIIASAHNLCEHQNDATCHAEIIAIKKASKVLKNWRLTGCTLYVTIEPCLMCTGAIINSRISRVVYGSRNKQNGGIDSRFNIGKDALNSDFAVTRNILADDCQKLMDLFFQMHRR